MARKACESTFLMGSRFDLIPRSCFQLKTKSYTTVDIKTSDHRPVYGTFGLTVHVVDQTKKQKVMDELNTKLEGKTPRTSSVIKPPPSVKRAPPDAPDRSKKTLAELNLISFDSAPSPTKGKTYRLRAISCPRLILQDRSCTSTSTSKALHLAVAA